MALLERDLSLPLERYRALDEASEQYVRGDLTLEEFEVIEQRVRPDINAMIERIAQQEVEDRIRAMSPPEALKALVSLLLMALIGRSPTKSTPGSLPESKFRITCPE